MEIIGVRQVAQRVVDLDRAIAFYRALLGAPEIARFDPPGLAFFAFGSTRLMLERNAPSALIYLHVPDLDAAVQHAVEIGARLVGEPHTIFDDAAGTFGPAGEHERLAIVEDSEGNLLGLMARQAG